jgi:hypothetical protein
MTHPRLVLAAALIVVAALLLWRPAPAILAQTAEPLCFPETGRCLNGAFRRVWETTGGAARYGLPISDEFEEGGRTVQYTERARFEFHPEHAGSEHEVQLGLLGVEVYGARHRAEPALRLQGRGGAASMPVALEAGGYRVRWQASANGQAGSACSVEGTLLRDWAAIGEPFGAALIGTASASGETAVLQLPAGRYSLRIFADDCAWSASLVRASA